MLQVDVHVHTLFLKRTIETISHSCTSFQISPSPHPIPDILRTKHINFIVKDASNNDIN